MHGIVYINIQTLKFITAKILDCGIRPPFKTLYNGSPYILFDRYQTVINNNLIPLENTWVFPKEKFIIYEQSDEDWCSFFKIGRPGSPIGEIEFHNTDIGIINKIFINRKLQICT